MLLNTFTWFQEETQPTLPGDSDLGVDSVKSKTNNRLFGRETPTWIPKLLPRRIFVVYVSPCGEAMFPETAHFNSMGTFSDSCQWPVCCFICSDNVNMANVQNGNSILVSCQSLHYVHDVHLIYVCLSFHWEYRWRDKHHRVNLVTLLCWTFKNKTL